MPKSPDTESHCAYAPFNQQYNKAMADTVGFPDKPYTIYEKCQNCPAILYAQIINGRLKRGGRKIPKECKELR